MVTTMDRSAPSCEKPASRMPRLHRAVAGIFAMALATALPAAVAPQVYAATLPLKERMALRCPSSDAAGDYAKPTSVYPTAETPMVTEYSANDDTVRLSGPDTETAVELGSGDDTLFLSNLGVGFSVIAGAGADTIVICSMKELKAGITLGVETLSRDDDRDVVIIDSAVFTSVPPGMRREIGINDFDAATDILVIRAPADLLARKTTSLNMNGIRIGDVLISLLAPIGAKRLNYTEDAFVFVSTGE